VNEFLVTTPDQTVTITTQPPSSVNVTTPDKSVVMRGGGLPGPPGIQGIQGEQGIQGVPGNDAKWARLTQAEYDVLNPKDSQTLYVIIG
jgi:hypothetical protein